MELSRPAQGAGMGAPRVRIKVGELSSSLNHRRTEFLSFIHIRREDS
jgi:hypothetical protein